MKQRIFSSISLAAYLAMTLTGFIVGIGAILDSKGGADSSGLGDALAAVVLTLVGILAVAYAAFCLVPLICKLFDLFFQKRALTVTCIIFDVLLLLLHLLLFFSTILENGSFPWGILALCVASAASLIFNNLALHTSHSH